MSNIDRLNNKDKSLQNLTIRPDIYEAVKRKMSKYHPIITPKDMEGLNREEKEQLIYLVSIINLTRQTISKQLREFELGEHKKGGIQLLIVKFIDLLSVLHEKGMEGDIACIKLLAEILEKRGSKKPTINIKNQQISLMIKELATRMIDSSK